MMTNYDTIVLPTRPQPDTLIAIFLLKEFGEAKFPGVRDAKVACWQVLPEGATETSLDAQGVILLDIGGGRFDHHGAASKTTASDRIAEHLGAQNDPALAKLLEYARRDDFFGKGTISTDPLDRAFGLSALVVNLNRDYVHEPTRVVAIVLPLIAAHYHEEVRRTKELPKEFEEKMQKGEAQTFEARQHGNKLKIVMLTSDNASLSGYLRSQQGGRFDVVVQWLSSGHVNILTRPVKRVRLGALAAVLRHEEANKAGASLAHLTQWHLSQPGRVKEIPEWYYDPATNSIQNGGLNPTGVTPTRIPRANMETLVRLGLEQG